MKDVTLVVFQDGSEVFVTTMFNEERFVQEFFGSPDSKRKIEDFERTVHTNIVSFHLAETTSDTQVERE